MDEATDNKSVCIKLDAYTVISQCSTCSDLEKVCFTQVNHLIFVLLHFNASTLQKSRGDVYGYASKVPLLILNSPKKFKMQS